MRMRYAVGLFVIGLGATAMLSSQQAAAPVMKVLKDVMIPMRDGVRLATDVYLPGDGSGKYPVILNRGPYNKDTGGRNAAAPYVGAGYAYVVQDVRGRYKSEGKWRPIRDDVQDGPDTTKWIGEQAWSDGKIGTIGSSYNGATQHAMAIGNAPNLTAMVPRNAMSNFGRYGLRHNGAFELRFFNWIFMLGDPSGTQSLPLAAARAAGPDLAAAPALAELRNHVREYAMGLPLRAGTTPLKFAPDYESWLIEAMSHGGYDEYWKNAGSSVVDHLAEYKDVPAYHTTGWYDSWGTSVANMNFVSLSKAKKSMQRLIVGPWIHSSEGRNFAGEAQFTEDGRIDIPAFEVRWFDRWLRGKQNGVDKEPPVRIYVMGGGDAHKTPEGRIFVGGKWRTENEWPLARQVATPYYLHPDGLLSASKPGVGAKPVSYLFDPSNPVPTLGGNVSSQGDLMFQGAADQKCRADFWLCKGDTRPLSARSDVLVFQTPPLASDVEVTGRLIVKLWASSKAVDTDFTAKLIDVYPPSKDFPAGVDLNIGDSIVRARHRNGGPKEELLVPGKPYEFTIEMYPTSVVFQKGHRIRLDVSSSNFPRFDVNPNTGEPLNGNRRKQVAENTVYMDAAHPSHIVLPVIPAR
ncbi:antibiotic hydrolase [Bryobacterales bacterium F-183]|nr:antibiotic hydrolase [Bryobacterales bacterium F-183]